MDFGETYVLGRLLVSGARAARAFKFASLVRSIRSTACKGILTPLHHEVLFRMRAYAMALADWREHPNEATHLALDVCSEARKVLGDLLELREVDLHCCLKVLTRGASGAEDFVETCARSRPDDARTTALGRDDRHSVNANTVWCALLGRDDGYTHWKKPLPCFASNDLSEHQHLFACSRVDWSSYYQSVLVFPLTYPEFGNTGRFATMGFLAFDSPKRNAFPGVPDAFDHREKWNEYHQKLSQSSAFHLGGVMADVLAMFLRPAYERLQPKGANHVRNSSNT